MIMMMMIIKRVSKKKRRSGDYTFAPAPLPQHLCGDSFMTSPMPSYMISCLNVHAVGAEDL